MITLLKDGCNNLRLHLRGLNTTIPQSIDIKIQSLTDLNWVAFKVEQSKIRELLTATAVVHLLIKISLQFKLPLFVGSMYWPSNLRQKHLNWINCFDKRKSETCTLQLNIKKLISVLHVNVQRPIFLSSQKQIRFY